MPRENGHGHGHGHGHAHGYGHGHGHGHVHAAAFGEGARGDRQLAVAVAVNLGLTVAQVAAGVVAGSLAMIADAVHNLSDAAALVLALVARRIARRPPDARMSFGYGRIEIVAAFANYLTLLVIGLWLVWEAAARLVAPQPVEGWLVVLVAGLALAVDLATAALTWRLSRESVNVRAAFLHNLADALGSVAVIVAGTLILLYGWWIVDPIATVLIAGYILWHAGREIGPVVRMLMLGTPPGLDPSDVRAAIGAIDGVEDVHHLHVWQIDEARRALEAHVVADPALAPALRGEIREMLKLRFGIGHATLQMETSGEPCDSPAAGDGGATGAH